ncbi:MAG: nucleotidyl transferase AbiEii/AbiGii toxin family protein [bacterium]
MEYQNVFHLISDICEKQDVSCILIGGFAVNYYHVSRQTADVDFLITKSDFEKISGLLEINHYKQIYSEEIFTRYTSRNIRLILDIDFPFVDSETFSKIRKSGEKIKIAGREFYVPSLENLIALKLHSIKNNPENRQNKDLFDILELIKANKMDYNSSRFKELCLQYGAYALYEEIIKRTG